MSRVWKTVVALVLTLPVAAYITIALVQSGTDMSAERAPIVVAGASEEPSKPDDDAPPAPQKVKPGAKIEPVEPPGSTGGDDPAPGEGGTRAPGACGPGEAELSTAVDSSWSLGVGIRRSAWKIFVECVNPLGRWWP